MPTFVGDATLPEVLKQARADTAKAVIAATSSELANLEIALLVREMNPKQRVVVRLIDPQFAEAVRDAADIRQRDVDPRAGRPGVRRGALRRPRADARHRRRRTLVVIDLVDRAGRDVPRGKSLRAVMLDYRLLPVAFRGPRPADPPRATGCMAGDRLTVVAELPDLERLIRREPCRRRRPWSSRASPVSAGDRWAAGADQAELFEGGGGRDRASIRPFTLSDEAMTRGEAQELVEQVTLSSERTAIA